MPKRISVVGRGLGAYFPTDDAPSAPQDRPAVPEEVKAEIKRPARPKPETGQLPPADKSQGIPKKVGGGTVLENAASRVARQAYIAGGFRFSKEELAALADLVHETNKKFETRLTKQDVVRLALAAMLADHDVNGDKSLLIQYLKSGKRVGVSN